MYKKVSKGIILILLMAAFLVVPSSMVQLSRAQPNQDMTAVLNLHNQERAAIGYPPLTWSDSLAADAQSWANHLSTLGIVCGLQGCNPNPPHGVNNENMAFARTHPADLPRLTPAEMAQWWANEKAKYNAGQVSGPGIGHYTAMVWKSTRELGCGFVAGAVPNEEGLGGGTDILVCRYLPGGNTASQAPANLPSTCINAERKLVFCPK